MQFGTFLKQILGGGVNYPQDSKGGIYPQDSRGGVNNPNNPPYIRHWFYGFFVLLSNIVFMFRLPSF